MGTKYFRDSPSVWSSALKLEVKSEDRIKGKSLRVDTVTVLPWAGTPSSSDRWQVPPSAYTDAGNRRYLEREARRCQQGSRLVINRSQVASACSGNPIILITKSNCAWHVTTGWTLTVIWARILPRNFTLYHFLRSLSSFKIKENSRVIRIRTRSSG